MRWWGLLAVAAVAAALLLRNQPELLFRLPMGFIPFAIVTGRPPPHFFTYDAYEPSEFGSWTRNNDLIVSVGAKSGTNLMLYTAHLLRVKGDLETHPFLDVSIATPWTTMLHKPGQTWAEIKTLLNTTVLADGTKLVDHWNNPAYPFRVFKAHEWPRSQGGVLAVEQYPNIKFVAMVRNFADVLASFYPFFGSHNTGFRDMWGGFPPVYKNKEALLKDFLPGGALTYLYVDYVKGWYNARHLPNVLLLHYNEAVKQPEAVLRKLAAFTNVQLTDEQVSKILTLTTVEAMKKMDAFTYVLWGNRDYMNGTGTVLASRALVRKGIIGDHKEFFTEQEVQRIEAGLDEVISDPKLRAWLRTGIQA